MATQDIFNPTPAQVIRLCKALQVIAQENPPSEGMEGRPDKDKWLWKQFDAAAEVVADSGFGFQGTEWVEHALCSFLDRAVWNEIHLDTEAFFWKGHCAARSRHEQGVGA